MDTNYRATESEIIRAFLSIRRNSADEQEEIELCEMLGISRRMCEDILDRRKETGLFGQAPWHPSSDGVSVYPIKMRIHR